MFEPMLKVGLLSFDSCLGSPIMRNSVFDGLSDSRLAFIQAETSEKTDWRRSTEMENCVGENDM